MKKLIASLMALGAAGLLSAQVHFGLGARGTFGLSLGATSPWIDDYTMAPLKSFMAGGAVVGRLGFDAVPGLFIQPEIGFMHTSFGYKQTDSGHLLGIKYEIEAEGSLSYNSIDIPIIVGYDFEVGGSGLVVSPFAGLNLSIPVGSMSSSYGITKVTLGGKEVSTSSWDDDDDYGGSIDVKATLVPGALFGFGVGYKFDDHNMIMGDLRYLLDFTAVQADVWSIDLLTRRGLTLGFNYVYFF